MSPLFIKGYLTLPDDQITNLLSGHQSEIISNNLSLFRIIDQQLAESWATVTEVASLCITVADGLSLPVCQ